jgi:NAD(P)-dependent dehydrogenase (short-subunit alcohol dehydrogenase family)
MGILEGKVVIVTGASAGVGEGIALEAARQGARVVVNDLGVAIDGSGGSAGPATQTVDEIRAAGGDAVANTDSVAERAAAPHFKGQERGAYVHMTSTSGLIGNLGQANYAAAKMGIVGLSKSIALDMRKFNVRSNCIAPFRNAHDGGGWTAESCLERALPMLEAAFTPLDMSRDVFSWDPV